MKLILVFNFSCSVQNFGIKFSAFANFRCFNLCALLLRTLMAARVPFKFEINYFKNLNLMAMVMMIIRSRIIKQIRITTCMNYVTTGRLDCFTFTFFCHELFRSNVHDEISARCPKLNETTNCSKLNETPLSWYFKFVYYTTLQNVHQNKYHHE